MWTKNIQKPNFCEKRRKKSSKNAKTQKMSRDMPKLAIHPLTRGFHHVLQGKFSQKKMAILDHFQKKCSNLRPLFSITFPQGFWIFKNIGHSTWEVEAKRRLNSTSKVNTRKDKRTDRRTFRKCRWHVTCERWHVAGELWECLNQIFKSAKISAKSGLDLAPRYADIAARSWLGNTGDWHEEGVNHDLCYAW